MLKIFAQLPSTEFLETLSVNAAKRMFSGLQMSQNDLPDGNSTFSKLFNGEYLKLGSAVSVYNQDNNAKVNIGKNASINARKSIDISSNNKIAAQKLSTTATVNNKVPNSQKNEAMVGIGVQVSNVKNTADTVIKGSVN